MSLEGDPLALAWSDVSPAVGTGMGSGWVNRFLMKILGPADVGCGPPDVILAAEELVERYYRHEVRDGDEAGGGRTGEAV